MTLPFVRPERTIRWPDREALHSGAEVWDDAFASVPSFSWDLPSGSTVMVDDFEASGGAVCFWATVQHPDGRVIYEDDHVVIKPPILDDEKQPLDVLAFVRDHVEEHLP